MLLSRTPQNVNNITHFKTSAVKLSSGNEKVATDNFTRLKQLGEPIVQINAYHTNPKAKHLSAEDMGGLEPTIYLARKARVMLTRNFWTTAGLCNGTMGTVKLNNLYAHYINFLVILMNDTPQSTYFMWPSAVSKV